ncbi:hypothetical protein [Massilia glaciei]|uniref:Uncharacterized protein n=1 Tax=Massilia glaciei TaxID=1524097 RepID=A0A2U2HIQ6_9BURK|nr:hypothetical protein [Massilia glaciei]PWF46696.1 hypothetical protein C7C56_015770 [Massilia glaciei]
MQAHRTTERHRIGRMPAWAERQLRALAAGSGPKGPPSAPPTIPPIIITPFSYQTPAPAIDPRITPPGPPLEPPGRPGMRLCALAA